jgi:hypothetical protein
MLPSDIRSLHEAYQSIYEESDLLTDDLIEEIVEELVEECLEFGYDLDESADAVEAAATEYLMELNPYAPAGSKQAREYQKSTTSTKRGAERSAAITGAVDRVKATARGVKAAAGIAGSIAKDEVRRAGRTASHAVTHAVQKKKAEVKGGIKKMIGGGLRAIAGGIGKVAQRAAGAASKFGEEVELGENRAMARDPEGRKSGHSKQPDPSKPGFTGIGNMSIAQIAKMSARIEKDKKQNEEVEQIDEIDSSIIARTAHKRMQRLSAAQERENRAKDAGARMGELSRVGAEVSDAAAAVSRHRALSTAHARSRKRMGEEVEIYDVVLEYLISQGHANTVAEAHYVMMEMDAEMIGDILETRMDPRGRPASGPMNVYKQSKPNNDPAFQAALTSYREKEAKKTPAQRKAELDAYKERQMNR